MKIYLAGPMRGIPDFNHPAFAKVTARLRAGGHHVFSPAENDMATFGREFVSNETGSEDVAAAKIKMTPMELRRHVFEVDFTWICQHADAVALLPGWKRSAGAKAEKAAAEALGLQIIFIPKEWIK